MKIVLLIFFLGTSLANPQQFSRRRNIETSPPYFLFNTNLTPYTIRSVAVVSQGRKQGLSHTIDRLKSAGLWDKIDVAFLLRSSDEQSSLLNFRSVDFTAQKISTPLFTNHFGWTSDADTKYLSAQWNPLINAVDTNNFHVAVYSTTAALSANADLGCVSGGNGISINVGAADGSVAFRANGPLVSTAANLVNGLGFVLITVNNGTYKLYRNGELLQTASYVCTDPVNVNLQLLNANGLSGVTGRTLGYFSIGRGDFTDAVAKEYFAIVQSYIDDSRGGWPEVHSPFYVPLTVSKDFIVYGANMQGCLAAFEAARQGRTVAIVGGWRERHLGGMTASGIGVLDVDDISVVGGLPRLLITRINSLAGLSNTNLSFQPRLAEQAIRGFLDSSRSGGIDIPVYWSTGIAGVLKSGTRITSFSTTDGRTFSASQFCDASYEGDLMALAGCSNIIGREAAGTGNEAWSGERGTVTTQNGNQSQYNLGATFYNVDPYVVPGNSGSGRIAGVNAPSGASSGTADSKLQAYNFRLTLSKTNYHRAAQPSVPPSGFDIATYEAFLRFLQVITAAGKVYGTHYSITDLLYFVPITGGIFQDVNQYIAFGPNYYGQSWGYPAASYAARETIWAAHRSYLQGLWYTMSYGRSNEGDTRIPVSLETDARAYGLDRRHYCDPYPGDEIWWPYQLYVRQARRLIGDFIYDANDLGAVDGTTPRSTSTIGCASYNIDPHHAEAIADPNSGTPRIWNTGMVVVGVNGANNYSPLPYEIILPKAAECTNLTVPFCISATHIAFGSIRMELSTMTLAQAAGLAAAIALENGNQNIQSVSHATLRSRLLASATLSGEVAPVLPQTN